MMTKLKQKRIEFYDEKYLAEIIYCLAKKNCQPCVKLAVSLEECKTGAQTTINALNIAEKMLVDASGGDVTYEEGHPKEVDGGKDDDRYTKAFLYLSEGRKRISSDELSLIPSEYLPDTLYTLALNCHEQVETLTELAESSQLNVEDALKEAKKELTQHVRSDTIEYHKDGSVANVREINNLLVSNAISAIGVELKKRDIDFY